MRKNPVKSVVALMMALIMVLSGMMVMPTTAEAAAKAKSITLSTKSKTLYVGGTYTLKVKSVKPGNASKSVSYKSSKSSVATVSSKGKITAKKAGSATITVTSKSNSKVKATCKVTVKQKVTSVTLSKTTLALQKGKSYTLKASVKPSNASSKKVTYKSSKSSVATVSSKGKITAKKAGTATIKVTAADGSKKNASCKVVVFTNKIKSVKINTTKKTLNVGKTYTLKTTVTSPKSGIANVFSWKSSNTKVATVSDSGKVTAKKGGTATITATALDGSKKKVTCKITVNQPVKGISLSSNSATMLVGQRLTLKATVSPSDASKKTVAWATSNPNIAVVSNGIITAKAVGRVTITAASTDGTGKKASCTITINPVKVSSVTLNKTALSLTASTSQTLTATVLPLNAANRAVVWSSSNLSIAAVSNGTVTAKAPGTAVITATAADGSGKKASCTVTVAPIKVSGITLNKTTLSLVEGAKEALTATVAPANATNKTVVWSSNSSVATVSNGTVTAVSAGTATITVKAQDGSSKSASCIVTVTSSNVPVTGVTLDQSTAEIKANETLTLNATVAPANATDKTIEWTTSNKDLATVAAGVVTPIAEGTVTITATAGTKTASCEIKIIGKANALTGADDVEAAFYTYQLDKKAESYEVTMDQKTNTITAADFAGDVITARGQLDTFKSEYVDADGQLPINILETLWAKGNDAMLKKILEMYLVDELLLEDITFNIANQGDGSKIVTVTTETKTYRFKASLQKRNPNGLNCNINIQQLDASNNIIRDMLVTNVMLLTAKLDNADCYLLNMTINAKGMAVSLNTYIDQAGGFVKVLKDNDPSKLVLSMEEVTDTTDISGNAGTYVIKINKSYYGELKDIINLPDFITDYTVNNVYVK